MDINKQKKFNERMGRQKFARGGRIHLKHFDTGGSVPGVGGPNAVGGSTAGVTPGIGGIGNVPAPVQNLAPSSLQGPMNEIQSLNPMSQLQAATQNNFLATAPQLQAGTNAAQLNQAYGQAQGGIGQQQALLSQIQAQNGLGNQSQIYGQLQGISNGTGPNPAQAQLAQSTGQNVANQAALMAGQRGAAGNVGLMARQNAQQGAATQQQAAGQAANLQANQSLNAINSAGNIANTQAENQIGATTGLNTAAQNEQSLLQGANNNLNSNTVSAQSNLNNVNAQTAQGNQAASNGLMGGLMNGASSVLSALSGGGIVGHDGRKLMAVTIHSRGMKHHYDDGGSVDYSGSYTPEVFRAISKYLSPDLWHLPTKVS